ncbi:MAG: hypothetical protein IJ480_10185 [Clostridia bacterium]|nr:hypothetical protein [Clostridia bacterium]
MKQKWICILLAMLCLTGCGGAEDTPEETVPEAEQTAAVETEPVEYTREEYPDELPERDFGGKDYVICSTEVKRYEVLSDELTGEACNDAVYHRNMEIEERFNTKISSLIEAEPESVLRESAISGDNAFEIAGYVNYKAYVPIAAHAAMNWNDIPYVDQSKPWHNQLANEPATINGKLFAINSDLSISSLQYTYGIFFNYKLAEDYGYTPDELYQMVFDGTWTIDTFREMIQDIWVDVDGNAEHDRDDIHGYSVCPGINTSDVWLAALDLDLATLNNDGTYSVDFFNEKTVSALEKCMALTYDGVGTYNLHQDWRQVPVDFASGKVMMTQMYFGETTESLKDMEDTYGILPLPKFDEAQQAYYTNAWDQFSVFSVPVTAEDPEFVGILYEALSAETWRSVYPAYYDTALKSRYSAEANVAKIVDLIMEGRKFEFSFQFGNELQDLPYMFRAMLRDKTTDIASRYNAIESKLKESIKVMYSYYE